MNALPARRPRHLRGLVAMLSAVVLGGCAGTGATGAHAPRDPVDPIAEITEAQATLAERPDDTEAWFRLGVGWQMRAEHSQPPQTKAYQDSARVAFEAVLERDPEDVKALVHHGLVLEDLGRDSDALLAYQKATELAPDDALPLVDLASLLYFKYRKTFEAKEALTKALGIDPKNADAHFNLGVLFADASLFHEAAVEWNQVIEDDPDGPASKLARENLDRIRPILDMEENADTGDGE